MGKPKRALPPSSSSGQPSQHKRPCVPPIDRAWNGSEMNPVPSCCLTCCLTKEDLRNMFREELERAKSDWAKYFQRNAVEEIVQEMQSMENASKKLEHGDAIVMKALANWNDVREFNGETFSDSMQKNSSSSYSSSVLGGQTENRNHVQRYLAPPIVAAPVGPEAPLANAGSAAEGLNGAMALALPVQSQNTNSGTSMKILVDENFRLAAHQLMSAGCSNVQIPPGYHDSTTAGLPTQSHGLNLQNSMHSKMIGSSSGMDCTGYDDVLPEGIHVRENNTPCNDPFSRTLAPPKGNDVMEDIQSSHSDDSWKQWLADNPLLDNGYVGENNTPCNDPFSRTLAPPEGNGVMEDIQSNHSGDSWKQWSADNPLLDNGYVGGTGRGVIGWLKIKAVLQWGYFIRKRGVRLVELDQPPIQVQACS